MLILMINEVKPIPETGHNRPAEPQPLIPDYLLSSCSPYGPMLTWRES